MVKRRPRAWVTVLIVIVSVLAIAASSFVVTHYLGLDT